MSRITMRTLFARSSRLSGLEFDLLAYCCGLARGIPTLMAMAVPGAYKGLDEERFVAMAVQHKVAGTSYKGLEKAGIKLSPRNMRNLAREAMVGHATRSLLFRDWHEIVAAFKAEGIRALTIKGPASSVQLYGDPLTREFYDLDILADIPDIQPVLPVMARLGYAPSDPSALLHATTVAGPFIQKPSHHVSFQKAGRPFHIEIHGKTWQDDKEFYPAYIEELFVRAVPLAEGKGWGDTLSPADHIVFMVAHGTQHAWCLLHWLLDLAVALDRTDEVLHRTLAEQIRVLNMGRQLKLACMIVRSVYPVAIPESIQDIIDGENASLEMPLRFALARLQQGGRDHASMRNILLHSAVFLPALTKAPGRKVQLIFSPFLTPQRDVEALPLPKHLYFLYLPLRLFFVLSRRLKKLFGREDTHAA